MALGIVRWTPDQEDHVRAMTGALRCGLAQDNLLSYCLSSPNYIYICEFNAESNPAMAWHLGWSEVGELKYFYLLHLFRL